MWWMACMWRGKCYNGILCSCINSGNTIYTCTQEQQHSSPFFYAWQGFLPIPMHAWDIIGNNKFCNCVPVWNSKYMKNSGQDNNLIKSTTNLWHSWNGYVAIEPGILSCPDKHTTNIVIGLLTKMYSTVSWKGLTKLAEGTLRRLQCRTKLC